MIRFITLISIFLFPLASQAKLNILTTTTNLKSLVEIVGGENVSVSSICKGTQDPHYIEAKPSFTLKAARADLLISIGLDLEIGWLPLILRGSRNPKLRPGEIGSFVAGEFIDTLEKPTGKISRSEGDVHPEGNPHFMLDPLKALTVASHLKDKLIQIDPEHSPAYEDNFNRFASNLKKKLDDWKKRIPEGKKVITYHKTLTYFYQRFGIRNIAQLEPKPGVPPSASHILNVMKEANKQGVQLALVENYFDPSVAYRVAKGISGLKVKIVPVSVNGEPGVSNLFDLYEKLVQSVEGK